MKIGVLALQGDFAAHARMIERLGAKALEVRREADLMSVDGLILPGGESTTMLKFIEEERLSDPIKRLARQRRPMFGTCAGAILLARKVTGPRQTSLGLIDIEVERNGYGRQVESFISQAETIIEGGPVEAVFIRAPRIRHAGPKVQVLARAAGEPVFVREREIFAATFHPELTQDERPHRLFLHMVENATLLTERREGDD
jgi:pyridoxal 5'-phosphate synthase pdxT subunit